MKLSFRPGFSRWDKTMVLCTSVHGLWTSVIMWLIGIAWWWVQALHSCLETSLDLNRLPCFIVDSLVNICDLAGVNNWGTTHGKGALLTVPWKISGGTYCSTTYGLVGPIILLRTVWGDSFFFNFYFWWEGGGTTYNMTGRPLSTTYISTYLWATGFCVMWWHPSEFRCS